jgi:hypothetical protein
LYRRRRPWPAIVILVILAAAGVTVWAHVLHQAGDTTAMASCPAPTVTPAGQPKLTPLPYTALDKVAPTPATQVRVRTLNAGSQVGLAKRIALEVQQYGFTAVGSVNDTYYPDGNMRCFAQIRFGPNGETAARTLSLLVPCAQLVRDSSQDSSVDLALGTYFTDLAPNGDATRALSQLAAWSRSHPASGGGLQSQAPTAPAPAGSLLAGAPTFRC